MQQKKRLVKYCSNISIEAIFTNMENNKTNETHKFVLKLLQRLQLKSLNNYVAPQNLSISLHTENITQQYKDNNFKIIVPTCNDEFKLPEGPYSVSDIQDYIE